VTAASARDIAAGGAAAEDAVERSLERLERWEPFTNAFSQVFAEEAREEANRPHDGVLAGVPVAVKDLFDVAGRETTGCTAAYRGTVASKDAPVVTALRTAGAIVIGKTNMHELAFGATNVISACGPTHNPWDPERITGGSSGGSGAAVASRVVPIALGTDTGGSIRIPSSLCGVFGLKPTHGRLPLDGVMPLAASLDCPGPMAWSAGDLALAWQAVAGEEPADALPNRVAVMRTERATDAVLEGVEAVVHGLAELGASSVDVPDGLAGTGDAWLEVTAPEFLAAHPTLLDRLDQVHPFIGAFLEFARTITPEAVEDGKRRQGQTRAWFDEQLRDAEILVMPATPFPAPRADDESVTVRSGDAIDVHLGGASTFTRAVNLAGLPSLALPAGRSPEELPVGVQLVGRRGTEPLLLAVAMSLEGLDPTFASVEPPSPLSA
jgi:Asp-tRNA(Asn)/Glu-tRNA(Gln) amidotransferase A subunit family amidase